MVLTISSRGENMLLHRGIVVEFLVELVSPHPSHIVAPGVKNMEFKVFSAALEGNGFAGHEHRIESDKGVFLGRLVDFGIITGKLRLFPLETV